MSSAGTLAMKSAELIAATKVTSAPMMIVR